MRLIDRDRAILAAGTHGYVVAVASMKEIFAVQGLGGRRADLKIRYHPKTIPRLVAEGLMIADADAKYRYCTTDAGRRALADGDAKHAE